MIKNQSLFHLQIVSGPTSVGRLTEGLVEVFVYDLGDVPGVVGEDNTVGGQVVRTALSILTILVLK